MADGQLLQIGIQIGIALGQLTILWFVFKGLSSKVEKLTEKHYEHTKEVADKYVKKEDLRDFIDNVQNRLVFMHNDLARRLEKLEERSHERSG